MNHKNTFRPNEFPGLAISRGIASFIPNDKMDFSLSYLPENLTNKKGMFDIPVDFIILFCFPFHLVLLRSPKRWTSGDWWFRGRPEIHLGVLRRWRIWDLENAWPRKRAFRSESLRSRVQQDPFLGDKLIGEWI